MAKRMPMVKWIAICRDAGRCYPLHHGHSFCHALCCFMECRDRQRYLVVGTDLWCHSWSTCDAAAAHVYTHKSAAVRIHQWITGDGCHPAKPYGLWSSRRTGLCNLMQISYVLNGTSMYGGAKPQFHFTHALRAHAFFPPSHPCRASDYPPPVSTFFASSPPLPYRDRA